MKKTILKIVVTTLLLLALGASPQSQTAYQPLCVIQDLAQCGSFASCEWLV